MTSSKAVRDQEPAALLLEGQRFSRSLDAVSLQPNDHSDEVALFAECCVASEAPLIPTRLANDSIVNSRF
jgi:hypothetical protein